MKSGDQPKIKQFPVPSFFLLSYSLGGDSEIFLDQVKGDPQRNEGDQEVRIGIANDTNGGEAKERGSGEGLHCWWDVLEPADRMI